MKVFLSVSRQANPAWIEKVVNYLQKYMPDVEIVRYAGGSYSSKPMLDCDTVVMIPPAQKDLTNYCYMGKGQTTEIQEMNKVNRVKDVYVMRDSGETIWCKQIQTVEVMDIDWTSQYATIAFKPDNITYLHRIIQQRQAKKVFEKDLGDSDIDKTISSSTHSFLKNTDYLLLVAVI